MGFVEGEFTITPLLQSIQSLRSLAHQIKINCEMLRGGVGEDYQFESEKISRWILEHVEDALSHTEDRLKSLGFLKTKSIKKRSPFAFIGSIQSALFGTVSEAQFLDLKNHISSNFKLIHSDNQELRGLVSQNREALKKTLNIFNTVKDQILNELNDNSKLFTRFFQVGFALDSIERVVIILNSIKTNADRNFISRYIFTPSILKNHILQLSDGLYGQSPVFNSRMIDFYYKIPISLSTVTDDSIKQIVSIPLISAVSMFHLSHSPNCPPAHVCVENQDGVVTIPVSDYLTCEAVTSKLIPTICRMRPCITSSSAVCRMVNVSTAVISTEIRFMAKVECNDGFSKEIAIQNITLVIVPIHCSLHSHHVKIRKVESMKNSSSVHSLLYVPFSISKDDLIFNSTSGIRQFESKGLKELLLTKIPKGHKVSSHLTYDEGHHPISLSSISISTISLCTTLALFTVLYCCRNRIFKSINPN